MRIFYLGNNRLGRDVLRWLRGRGEEIVGMALHPAGRARYDQEMRDLVDLPDAAIFDGSTLHKPKAIEAVRRLSPQLAVSILFGYILEPSFIEEFQHGVINLHPSFLPYNRGAMPNVWSILEEGPAGATLHYIDEGIDTGDIIAQRQVPVEPVDTGKSLYQKVEQTSLDLFKETWPGIRNQSVRPVPQPEHEGSYHRSSDVKAVDRIELDQEYLARDLIDLIRARTFPPYDGAYFEVGDKRVYMRLELYYGDRGRDGK